MKKTKLKKKEPLCTIDIESMPLRELCRWQALSDAVNLIASKCEDRGIDFDNINFKPLDIFDYVEQTADIIEHKVLTSTL